jgi:hypothetical protein
MEAPVLQPLAVPAAWGKMSNQDDDRSGRRSGSRAMDLLRRSAGGAVPGQPPKTRRSAGSWQPEEDSRGAVAASLPPMEIGDLDVRREAGSSVDDPTSMARKKVVPVEKAAPAPADSPPGSTAARERPKRRRPFLFLFVLILAIEIPSTPLYDPESSPGVIAELGDPLVPRGAAAPPAPPPPPPPATVSLASTNDPPTGRPGPPRSGSSSATASGGRAEPPPGVARLAGTARLEGGAPALDLSTERRATEQPGETSASDPGGTSASDPGERETALPEDAARVTEPAQPESCPAEARKDPVVLVFDGSVSMGLPLDMPGAIEVDLDRRMSAGDQSARLEYRRWLATDQPKRIDVAKQAVGEMLGIADPALSIAAVAFTGCREIASHPYVGFDGRSRLNAFVGSVTPRRGGDTALVRSLQSALDMIRGGAGGRGRVILLTDGQETCGGDVCALAEATAKSQPGVRVDVVDLSGLSNARCLAEATGGVIVNYAEFRGRLGHLLAQAANQCPAR